MAKRNSNRERPPAEPRLRAEGCATPGGSPGTVLGNSKLNGLRQGNPTVICLLLFVLVVWVFLPCLNSGFVNFDDPDYVTANPHVQRGLNWEGVQWACLNPVCFNWHPLTVLSHMLVCQVFGLNPWGHHLTNVLLHALNAALVFALLRRMTGATWRSLLVAALFAVHPLHVESVAWVAERKDVLSGSFGLLALIFYVRYAEARRQKVDSSNTQLASRIPQYASGYYGLSLFFLALGLMCKPVLVTWPFVMLLLDYWPLRRLEHSTLNSQLSTLLRLVTEKIPFFALAVAASVVTFVVQKRGGALAADEYVPLGARGGNALISFCRYLGKLFWPMDLAVFYPHPGHWPLAKVLLAGGLMLGISLLLFVQRRRSPFLLMGWLWFVGMLVPMIGLVQTGAWAMADRHTYIPSLGVLVLTIWGAHELTRRWRYHVIGLAVGASAAVLLCLALTRQQIGYWREGETLFRHALAVTKNNQLAQNNLGSALLSKRQVDEAIGHFREALRLVPDYPDAHNDLGAALLEKGQVDEAITQLQAALAIKPDFTDAHCNLGVALDTQGRRDEAIAQFHEALRLSPDDARAHSRLGAVLFNQGRLDEATRQFQEANRLASGNPDTLHNLGVALSRKGRLDEAISCLQEALRLKPDFAEAYCSLGTALGKQGRPDEAIAQLQEALRLKPDLAEAHCSLGAALGKQGRLDEAIGHLQEALRLKPNYTEAQKNLRAALNLKAAAATPPTASPHP